MDRFLLDSLMKLFAAISYENGISFQERRIVRNFLAQHMDDHAAKNYMDLFHRMAALPEQPSITELCTTISKNLNVRQKIIIYIRLVEIVLADKTVSSHEKQALDTIAFHFKIAPEEQAEIQSYHTHTNLIESNLPNLLIISGEQTDSVRHIKIPNLTGYLGILRINSIGLYILRYIGQGDLVLNSCSLHKGETYFLTQGSVIRGTHIQPIFQNQIASAFQLTQKNIQILFEAKNITHQFPNGKIALHPLSIAENSGQMIALMGASGAGKSTLLSILNGSEKPMSGEVLINGINIYTQRDKIEGIIGYIAQNDLLIEELTVYENIMYNAQFCFGNKSAKELENIVEKALKSLGLWEIRNITVGSVLNKKISGGQRKRLNIALELIREPEVLFVDEPTSGLSSRDSEMVMDLLKSLALHGKLVFVVIHQPSSDIFKMFDRLLLLDSGGYPVYYGNPVGALSYFKQAIEYINPDHVECGECGHVNAEMIFNILEMPTIDEDGNLTDQRRYSPEYWNQYFNNQSHKPNIQESQSTPDVLLHPPTRLKQFLLFAHRDIRSKSRNIAYLLINFLEAPLLAILLAFLLRYYNIDYFVTQGYQFYYNDNIPVYFFVSILVALFMGLTGSAEEILKDRRILNRERFLHLSKGAYISAKTTVLVSISAIQTLSFVLIANSILGIKGMDISLWLILWLSSCTANLMGLNISAAFDHAVTVYILVPLLLIPQIILSGAVIPFEKLNPAIGSTHQVPWIGEGMVSRWAYEALIVNQFMNNEYEKDIYPLDKNISIAKYKLNDWLPHIQTHLDSTTAHLNASQAPSNLSVKILKNELSKELYSYKNQFQTLIQALNSNITINTQMANEISAVLKALEKKYSKDYETAVSAKDAYIQSQTQDATAKSLFLKKELQYKNEAISLLVSNQLTDNKIIQTKEDFVQKIDPIYHTPESTKNPLNFRTHFLAPTKRFLGGLYNTFLFNSMIIISLSIFLYSLLYWDILRKLVNLPIRYIK